MTNTFLLGTKKQRELVAKNREWKAEEEGELGELKGIISYVSDNGDIKEINLSKRVTIAGKGKKADIKTGGFLIGESALLINREPDGFYVSRGDGRSSPKLNGKVIKGREKLRDNDFIEVGSMKMQFAFKIF